MTMRHAFALLLLVLSTAAKNPTITHETVTSGGKQRTYWLLVPAQTAGKPAPLIVLLHGSGHDGKILVDHWRKLAEEEGIVLAGPDAIDSQYWQFPVDGPNFLHDVVEAVKTRASIDSRRVFLFGHSAGAMFATQISMIESEYFAATVANAGGLPVTDEDITHHAARKIPILLIAGTKDYTAISQARDTRDTLQSQAFPVELREITGGTHDYYGRSRQINGLAWEFLSARSLEAEPKYIEYANAK